MCAVHVFPLPCTGCVRAWRHGYQFRGAGHTVCVAGTFQWQQTRRHRTHTARQWGTGARGEDTANNAGTRIDIADELSRNSISYLFSNKSNIRIKCNIISREGSQHL